MWIKELHIKNFGKFSDRKVELSSGLNLIYGENESGKSTLHTFIRSCLYGLHKMRGRASKKDEYSRYQPWEHGTYYAGSLRFVCGDKIFRLERDFAKGAAEGLLVCETDGERMSLEHGDLDMLLGGVGEVSFLNTVSIGQLKNETDEGLVRELQNYIANYQESGDQLIDMDQVLYQLKMKKKEIERRNLKEKEKQDSRMRHLNDYMGYLAKEKEFLLEKSDALEDEIYCAKKRLYEINTSLKKCASKEDDAFKGRQLFGGQKEEQDDKKTKKEGQQKRKTKLLLPFPILLLEVILLLFMLCICFLMGDYHIMKELIVTMSLISMVLIVAYQLMQYWIEAGSSADEDADTQDEDADDWEEDSEHQDRMDDLEDSEDLEDLENTSCLDTKEDGVLADGEPEDLMTLETMKKETQTMIEKLYWQKEHLQEAFEEKNTQIENCQQELKLSEEQFAAGKLQAYKENKLALDMASEYMTKAMSQMQDRIGISLKTRTSEIFSEITGGYYTNVQMDDNLCVGVHTKERYIPLEQLSRGTIWQVYFAYRMAAGELLTEEEPLPIMLDDAFVMYDEGRLMQVLSWLLKQDKQVLLFTCQKREKELLERMGAKYHEVLL